MAEEHNIPKVYDPASVEKKWYKYWEEKLRGTTYFPRLKSKFSPDT